MNIKERTCALCGLKMTQLSFQLWQCKCGNKEQGKEEAEAEGDEEQVRRRKLGGERDGRFKAQKQPAHKGLRHT